MSVLKSILNTQAKNAGIVDTLKSQTEMAKSLSENWVKNPVVIGRLFDRINMVVIPKVGGCEAAFSRHPRT
jgi:hypothetical protein